MFRIDNHSSLPVFQYNLTHFSESPYYYDIGASTITFSRKNPLSCRNLVYIFVKPFLFAFSKFLNLFSYLKFLFKRPAHFAQVTSRIYTGATPAKNIQGIKTQLNLDQFFLNDRADLCRLIRLIQMMTKVGNIYLYSQDHGKRAFISNLIHHYYGNKPTVDSRITNLGLTVNDLKGHTQDIYSGPLPIFRADFELLESENIKTVICFGNEEIPEDAKGLGLTYIRLPADFTEENTKKYAELIVNRSRFGAKLYFFSQDPKVADLLVPHIYRSIAAFRNPNKEQEYLSVPLD